MIDFSLGDFLLTLVMLFGGAPILRLFLGMWPTKWGRALSWNLDELLFTVVSFSYSLRI